MCSLIFLRWEAVFRREREKLISDRADIFISVSINEKKEFFMKHKSNLLNLAVMAFMIALGVVISPILRFEGMCPMAHFINITCSVLLGPWYSLICAVAIGIIRMIFMGIPPLALTGAVFGAFLSGVFYRLSKGKIIFAVLGEVFGTGIIGAIVSYPVMTYIWGKTGLTWLFYVPSFICGTLIGGSIAFVFLGKLANAGLLKKFQNMLHSKAYDDNTGILGNALSIAALGVIVYLVISILTGIFNIGSALWTIIAFSSMGAFILAGLIYYIVKTLQNKTVKADVS